MNILQGYFQSSQSCAICSNKKQDSFRVREFVADYFKGKKLPEFDSSEPHRILANLDLLQGIIEKSEPKLEGENLSNEKLKKMTLSPD